MIPDLFSVSDDDKAQGMAAVNEQRSKAGRELTKAEEEDIVNGHRLVTVLARLIDAGALPASEANERAEEIKERFRLVRKMKAEITKNTAAGIMKKPYLQRVNDAALALLDGVTNISPPRKIMQLRGNLYSAIFDEPKSPFLRLFCSMARDIDAALFLVASDFPYSFHPETEFLKKDLAASFERQTVH